MGDDGLEPGHIQPSSSAMKYMTVPEKIELTGTSGGVYSTTGSAKDQSGYRPMKVPDMITLEPTTKQTTPNEGSGLRDLSQMGRWRHDGEPGVINEPTSQIHQGGLPVQPPDPPSIGAEMPDLHPAIVDLDMRVRTLEQQVQRLKDVAVNRGGVVHPDRGGNNFWYVVTFAGWMMVPLIVAYMYRYKR